MERKKMLSSVDPALMWEYTQFLSVLKKEAGAHESVIGESEQGRPIYGFELGHGPITISLVAGAHADEPVGPNTLYRLILSLLQNRQAFDGLLSRFRFLVIPHVNPDGDAANASWIRHWPDPERFFSLVERELPGRDIEFGYPDMRVENRAASEFWWKSGPADIHVSLHGMAVSEGFLLLVNDAWESKTRDWRNRFRSEMEQQGLMPHDHDRAGDKGFNYMGPGFSSTPKGSAMRQFFLQKEDTETAAMFRDSSMEFHLGLNPSVFCLVTEFPLFLLPHSGNDGIPKNYQLFREVWKTGGSIAEGRFDVRPMALEKAMDLQLYTVLSAATFVEEFFADA
ncbi:M14 family zinc carboxypeptidase [Balneolales bacterium ANBcel1]|nr:M14 family zinc carboxypeptidase [Balneolales bacterium ANBcel1]